MLLQIFSAIKQQTNKQMIKSSASLSSLLQKTFRSFKTPPLPLVSSSTTTKLLKKTATSLLLTLPVAIWFTDKIYTTVTIVGSSMEPTLQHGDVLLIRRSDLFLGVRELKRRFNFFSIVQQYFSPPSNIDNDNNDNDEKEEELELEISKVKRMDGMVGKFQSGWISYPPLVLGGDVVVYLDGSTSFPNKWNVKRVIGLGGQRVRPSKEWRTFISIPYYSLWVEGDNINNSDDSNETGPISKKSIVGVAECIIWPPSRAWGGGYGGNNNNGGRFSKTIERIRPLPGRAWWA